MTDLRLLILVISLVLIVAILLMYLVLLPIGKLMKALKCSKENELNVKLSDLMRHHKAGGDVTRWMEGFASAKGAGLFLTIEKAAELELDGLDILKVAEILNKTPKNEEAV